MWSTAIIRFIRRRFILGLILTVSLIYCILSYVGKSDFSDTEEAPIRRTQPFIWRTLQQHNSSSDPESCRNSVQGKVLIVDDRGYVCPRHEILSSGCCNDTPPANPQYSCETCRNNNCCAIFEFCISCCLHPDKSVVKRLVSFRPSTNDKPGVSYLYDSSKDMLESVLGRATEENNVLFASVTDHFELCLAKCRTNSQSVQHENSYKDPKAKHCFGELGPGTPHSDNEV